MSFNKKRQQGQVLVIILLVSVVGLTIGLSIAGRSLQTVEQTAQTEEANRAFSAAEAGIEEALLDLSAGTPIPTISSSTLEGGGEVSNVDVNPDYGLETELKKDEVVQVKLDGASATGLTLTWDRGAALVLSKISGSSAPYSLEKYAWDSQSRGNGFDGPGSGVTCGVNDKCSNDTALSIDGGNDQILRIRAMYKTDGTELTISLSPSGSSLPIQGTEIKSTGSSGESQRTVRVVRSLPALPEIFDYVLFSGGSISK